MGTIHWQFPGSIDQCCTCCLVHKGPSDVHRCIVGQGQWWGKSKIEPAAGPVGPFRNSESCVVVSRSPHCQQECNHHASSYPNHNHSMFGSHTSHQHLIFCYFHPPGTTQKRVPLSLTLAQPRGLTHTVDLKHLTQIRSICVELG